MVWNIMGHFNLFMKDIPPWPGRRSSWRSQSSAQGHSYYRWYTTRPAKQPERYLDTIFSSRHAHSNYQWACYRGNRVDGVHDGEEQDVVNAGGVTRVPGSRDFLAGGIVDVAGTTSNVHLVVIGIRHCIAWAAHVLILYQSLTLVRHQNHIAKAHTCTNIITNRK